jgi:predicted TIM-barrel enzyme
MSKLNDAVNVNEDRADWAKTAIDTFRKATGTDADDAIGDLIVDLLHLGRRSVKNFNAKPFLDGNLHRFQIEESQEGGRVVYVGLKAFDAKDV